MRSLPKSLRWCLRLLASLAVLYLVAGNVLLNTALGPRLVNQRPAGFRMHWSWGVTLWPGWIYLRQPAMQGHARWQAWAVQGESAYGRIALWPLLRRRLVFAGVHASDVRVQVARAASERVPPPWRADAWTVDFRAVRTGSLRQVRWHGLTFEGAASAEFGFSHQLRGGPTRIHPSRVQVSHGTLAYRDQTLLKTLRLDLQGEVASFRHDQPPGVRKLELTQARLRLDATTPALAPTAQGGPRSWLGGEARQASGTLHADFALDRGTVGDGAIVRWQVPLAIRDPQGQLHEVPAQLDLRAVPGALQLTAKAESTPDDATRHAEAELRYASRHVLDVAPAELLRRIDGRIRTHWHFASLGWLGPWLARDWLHLQGEGELDSDLRIAHGVLQPGSEVDLPAVQLQASVFDNRFAGRAHAHLSVDDRAEDPLALTVTADRYTLAAASHPDAVYLHGDDLSIALRSTAQLLQVAGQAHGRLQFHDAQIPDLRAYNRYLPGSSVQVLGGSGHSSADLRIGQGGKVLAGTLQLQGHGIALALGVSRLHTDLDLRATLDHAEATAPRHYTLSSFDVGLSHVRLDDADDGDWWAKARLSHGELDWREPFQLRGDVQLAMKNASVLLSLFAKRHAFPAWIAHIVDDGRMEAAGQLAVGKRKDGRARFVLDDVQAHNQRIDLKARLRILDGKPDGALYTRWGILGLGVALKDGRRDFHLVGASKWYDAQPPLLGGRAPPTTPTP